MSKKQVISLVTLGAMFLSGSAGVLADELVVGSPESTIVEAPAENQPVEKEVEMISDVVDIGTGGTVIGSDDATITPPSTDDSIIVQPNQPEAPKGDDSSVEPKVEEKPVQPELTPNLSEKPENPIVSEPKTPEPSITEPSKEIPKTDVEQADKGKEKEQKGTDDPLLKPIEEPTPEQPIVSDKGHKIVGTQNSQLLVQKEDGTIQIQQAEEVGATVNSDGTVALKTSTGELKRLPKTGDDMLGSIVISVSGLIALFGTVFVKIKHILH